MGKSNEIQKKSNNQDFVSDYLKIVNTSTNSVIVKTEWTNNGDFFQKLSMYDNSYAPISTLGETTLIKSL